jgi:starch-binding outer membrane protein SusE/F
MKTKLLLLFAVVMTSFSVNAQVNSVAIVGTAVGGWPGEVGNPGPIDVNQLAPDGPNKWKITINIAAGPCKLRANNAWSGAGFEWAGAFPTAVGTSSGDIIVPVAGEYTVTLDTTTNVYLFTGSTPIPTVKLVGSAVTGGSATMSPTSATGYSLPLTTFLSGTAQFEIDGVLAGGDAFPAGTLQSAATPLINVVGAAYSSVTLDLGTGAYNFTAAPLYAQVTLIGEAFIGGWSTDSADFDHTDVDNYFLNNVTTTAGQGKFRLSHDWPGSFGGAAFPSGIAVVGNDNITGILAGNYDVKVNLATKAFSFLQTPISIIGEAVGGWAASNDIDLSTNDGVNYVLENQVMTAGACKFRRYHDWPGSLGASTFPSGIATVSNDNITGVIPGTYNITFNKLTGAFTFTPNLATTSFVNAGFKVSPNPTNDNWNFTSAKEAIVSVQVIDMLGKVVATSASANVDASALNTGVYFAKVTTTTATATVKVVRN